MLRLTVTLGPKSFGKERELRDAGATEFRLNASHIPPEELRACLEGLTRQMPEMPVVVDLQGAKMRLGDFPSRSLAPGDRLEFGYGARAESGWLPLPHREPFQQLDEGERVSIDDDRVEMEVEEVDNTRLILRSLNQGMLRARVGFNRKQHPILLEGLSAQDLRSIEACQRFERVSFAVSFVADGRECDWIRREVSDAKVIAKLERQEALTNLVTIAGRSDGLWVCRGDLGSQLGLLALGQAVHGILPRTLPVPVSMAGQVFEHLTLHAIPTRSEICHLWDLLERGYCGVVLSDETAIGNDPVNATSWASRLLGVAQR